MTSLRADDPREDPLEDLVPTIQSFVKSKVSEKKAVAKQMKKPEHRIVKPTHSNRLDLAIMTWTDHQKQRKREYVDLCRTYKIPIGQGGVLNRLIDNQIERLKILKEEQKALENIEREYEKAKEKYEVIPIENLRLLETKEFYDHEYMPKIAYYEDFVRKIEAYK